MDSKAHSHYNRNIPMVIMDDDMAYNNNKTENNPNKNDKSALDTEASIGLIDPPRKPAEQIQQNNPYASFPGSDLASAPTANEDDNWSDDDEEIDVEDKKTNLISRVVVNIQEWVKAGYGWLMRVTRGYLMSTILFVGYCAYFIAAMMHKFGDEGSIRLLCCTVLGLIIMFYSVVASAVRRLLNKCSCISNTSVSCKNRIKTVRFFTRWLIYGGLAAIMVWALVEQGMESPGNLRSLPGLFVFLVVPLLFSTRPGKINWHTVYWSIGLQFLGALLVLRWKIGHEAILWIQARLDEFFHNTRAGSKLLFGDSYEDHYMIFGALPIVFFTNATLTILYYLGVIQFVVKVIGNILNFILGTSPAESMAVAAGIFMEGVTAILALRPYLRSLSKSQLFLVITSVFSSLGGAYLAILSAIGVSLEFLIPAMVVSAPATFAVCKIMIPETKWKKGCEAEKKVEMDNTERSRYANIVDAAQTGATSMLTLVGNIAVVAFAFFSYIEWINHTLGWFGDRVGVEDLSIEFISSYLLYPVAALMGIEAKDCRNVAMLLGYRLGINNIIAFFKLTELKVNKAMYHQYLAATNGTGPVTFVNDDIVLDMWNKTLKDGFISSRSEAIITYTLCGFSSFLSVVITIGIMYMLVPNRRAWISKVTIPALIAGNLANCMTGCFASIFY